MTERLAEDRRHWVPNPGGHRAHEVEWSPMDGDTVDTVFGEAIVIRPPSPPNDDWYCDMCSKPILTRWGDEPFPVPMFGSYALCIDHFNEAVERWKHDTEDGDVSTVPMGEWPLLACTCTPCWGVLHGWFAAQAQRRREGRS